MIAVSAYSHRERLRGSSGFHMIWIAVHANFVNTFLGTDADRFKYASVTSSPVIMRLFSHFENILSDITNLSRG